MIFLASIGAREIDKEMVGIRSFTPKVGDAFRSSTVFSLLSLNLYHRPDIPIPHRYHNMVFLVLNATPKGMNKRSVVRYLESLPSPYKLLSSVIARGLEASRILLPYKFYYYYY